MFIIRLEVLKKARTKEDHSTIERCLRRQLSRKTEQKLPCYILFLRTKKPEQRRQRYKIIRIGNPRRGSTSDSQYCNKGCLAYKKPSNSSTYRPPFHPHISSLNNQQNIHLPHQSKHHAQLNNLPYPGTIPTSILWRNTSCASRSRSDADLDQGTACPDENPRRTCNGHCNRTLWRTLDR